jgi:adenylyl- and sulfurtransferase ThiI
MTKDDIIRMARQVGGVEQYAGLADKVCWAFNASELEAFATLVAEAEREECAKIAFNARTYIEAAHEIRERGAP